MLKHIMKVATAVAFGLVLDSAAYCQTRWEISEIYSSADGSVQFIELFCAECSETEGLPALAGQTLVASDGKTGHSFTFESNVTNWFYYGCESISGICFGPIGFSLALVATQRFADLNLVKPDFVVPNGFLFLSNGTVQLGASKTRYDALPADGWHARMPDANVVRAVARNNAGENYRFIPEGAIAHIEYYNAGLDAYFLTADENEVFLLDAGRTPGWQRTVQSIAAWTSPNATFGKPPPSNLIPVCRLWLGDSHFYSISKSECAEVAQRPGAVVESHAAFLATLPNANTHTGACAADQTRVYRFWNPRGSSHRYVTQAVVREEMLARGWIAEGDGPDGVAMCVGEAAQ